jgi:hypothetical protein
MTDSKIRNLASDIERFPSAINRRMTSLSAARRPSDLERFAAVYAARRDEHRGIDIGIDLPWYIWENE